LDLKTVKGAVQAPFFLALFVLVSGCASVDYSDYYQTLLIRSEPPGAQVYEHGEFIGTTPGFLRVRRRKQPELTIRYGEAVQSIPLEAKYRWWDSFAGNLLFLTAAPLGMGIDWATGTMWGYRDPAPVQFHNAKKFAVSPLKPRLSIAPPAASDFELTDTMGNLLQGKLESLNAYQVHPYNETALTFRSFGSEQSLTTDRERRNNLFYALHADVVAVPKVELNGDSYRVTSDILDVYSDKIVKSYKWDVSVAGDAAKSDLRTRSFFNEYFHFIPNSVFLNFTSYQPSLTVNGQRYDGHELQGHALDDQVLRYVSAITVERQERPRQQLGGHWAFDFVPSINISKKYIEFPDYPLVSGSHFVRWYASAGYGLEIAYKSRYGQPFLDVIPSLAYTRLNYFGSNGAEGLLEETSLLTELELGYTYFASDHVILKVFTRSLAEDPAAWDKALSRVSNQQISSSTGKSTFVGVSVGYFIPASLSNKVEWKARPAKN
jgi:hypothetical protein